MIDDATLAGWENDLERMSPVYAPRMRAAIAEIQRLREGLAQEPTREWYEKRCAWYGDELDRRKADLAAHRAVVRELAEALTKDRQWLGPPPFGPDYYDSLREDAWDLGTKALADPLIQQVREEGRG